MKILILGGTGAMGKHLVKILSYNRNNKLYITSRSHHISGDNLQYYLGDAHNMNFIQSIVDKVDYDAIIDFMYYSTQVNSDILHGLFGESRKINKALLRCFCLSGPCKMSLCLW